MNLEDGKCDLNIKSSNINLCIETCEGLTLNKGTLLMLNFAGLN